MTLFKRVFRTHVVGGPDDSEQPSLVDDFEYNDDPGEEIVSRLASLSLSELDEEPAATDADEDEIAEQDVTTGSEPDDIEELQRSRGEPPQQPQQSAKPEPDVTLAERAAAAHQQIEMSKQQTAFRRDQPEETDDPVNLEMSESASDVPSAEDTPETDAKSKDAQAPSPFRRQRPSRSARRVRTRLLGFDHSNEADNDPFAKASAEQGELTQKFPVGWFVIVSGPGKGNSFAVYNGASTIGRGDDQTVSLDFGDMSISRQNHAAFAYDDEQRKFYLGHGGKSNIIRLNDRPVLSTEELSNADIVRIGETSLRFVALCGSDFTWGQTDHDKI